MFVPDVLLESCATRQALERLASKWRVLVVYALLAGAQRHAELRRRIPGISAKVLTETLRDLERDGLVERHVYAEVPPRVEYELTPLGRTLHAPLEALGRWAEEHIEEVLTARETYDTRR